MVEVTCAIIFFDDKVLVTQRSELMSQPLKWEFPGGKLESGEDEVDCIKREIKEETNVEIEIIGRLTNCQHDYGTFSINLIPFVAKYSSGEIKLSEHRHYQIISIDCLSSLDWAAADVPIVKELCNYKK